MINWNEERKVIKTRQEVVNEIKEILIDSLMLDIDRELIMNDQPLFGRGLELDSIDALELIVLMEKKYGIKLANPSEGKAIFTSVASIADYVSKHRKK